MVKTYYKIKFKLTEPFSLGSGEDKHSDRDLLTNSKGQPFIPGTSLCGVYRALFDDEKAKFYFGATLEDKLKEQENKPKQDHAGKWDESRVIVYDAVIDKEECEIYKKNDKSCKNCHNCKKCKTSIRDGVGLDEFKTARDGAKFDFEIVEPDPNIDFVTYLEISSDTAEDVEVGDTIARAYQNESLYFGHKTTRGYGGVKSVDIKKKSFNLNDETQLKQWIKFNMYDSVDDSEGFSDGENISFSDSYSHDLCTIKLELRLRDGISIRRYTTDISEDEGYDKNGNQDSGNSDETENEKNYPDYIQMNYKWDDDEETKSESVEIPCIPGTTWAGAFRHHIEQLLPSDSRDRLIKKYFGYCSQGGKAKSEVRFSESQIKTTEEKGEWKTISRNAIDRFTGGTIEGALYTEKAFFGGTTELTISFPKRLSNIEDDKLWRRALAAAITDLDQGFLAVGGLTAVGRGLFEVKKCDYNGKEIYSSNKPKDIERSDAPIELVPILYSKLLEKMRVNEQEGA